MREYPTLLWRHGLNLRNNVFITVLQFSHSDVFNNEHNSYTQMSAKMAHGL
jgi:hypothetical protein